MYHNRGISQDEIMERRQGNYLEYTRETNNDLHGSSKDIPHNLVSSYHRSSSSSTASSGKHLVKCQDPSHNRNHIDGLYGRLERGYNNGRETKHHHHTGGRREDEERNSSSASSSPDALKRSSHPMFMLGPPSTPESSRGSHSTLRSFPTPPSEASSILENDRLSPNPHMLHPGYGLQLHPKQILTPPEKNSKISSIYDAYWHIPRASLWCAHKECQDAQGKCSQCQLKDETSSTCSSVNPPPTFTAMDNYRPIRKRPSKCSCGAIFATTTVFCTIVLVLIMAFILYIELVLKKKEYIPDPM